MTNLKVAVLICDIPAQSLLDKHGDYLQLFKKLLNYNNVAGHEVITVSFNVMEMQYPEIGAFDAYLMTGSRHSAYGTQPWITMLKDFVVKLDSAGCKIIGICFGHQIVAEALGGKVESNPLGWEVGNTVLSVNELGMKLIDGMQSTGRTTLNLQQMHRDHVTKHRNS
jgi:GMP synthase-like glutamine amidotransferase